mgnify:CR=1 FL=1
MAETSEELTRDIARLVDDKLAEDIVGLDMRELVTYTDYLVICTARNERQAEVVDTNVRVVTPRGTFEGCVQVNEDGGEMEIHVETIYCTDIGAVAMRSSMTSDMTGQTVTQRAELREYVVGGQLEEESE